MRAAQAAGPALAPAPGPKEPERSDEQIQADTMALLDGKLRSEVRDPKWGPEMEGRLTQALAGAPGEGLRLLGTDCQSTLCRIEVERAAGVDPEKFLEALRGASLLDNTQLVVRPLDDGSGRDRSVLFLSRPGQPLPTPGPSS